MSRSWSIGVVVLALLGSGAVLAQSPTMRQGQTPGDVFYAEFGDYWLGVAVSRPVPSLQSQLKLPQDQGLVVETIKPDSPAAKAGLQPYDILMKANDVVLKDIPDLLREINKTKEGKLSLNLIRGGKYQVVAVTPGKRPAESGNMAFSGPAGGDRESIEAWMRQMMPRMSEGQPLRFQFIHPGQILPPGATIPGPFGPGMGPTFGADVKVKVQTEAVLPDGYKVEIVRDSGKPAQVTVTHDKEKWEATEGNLDKLPEKIRPQVQHLLAMGAVSLRVLTGSAEPAMGGGMIVGGGGTSQAAPSGRVLNYAPVPPRPDDVAKNVESLQKRLDDVKGQVEQLRKSVEELQHRSGVKPEGRSATEKKP